VLSSQLSQRFNSDPRGLLRSFSQLQGELNVLLAICEQTQRSSDVRAPSLRRLLALFSHIIFCAAGCLCFAPHTPR